MATTAKILLSVPSQNFVADASSVHNFKFWKSVTLTEDYPKGLCASVVWKDQGFGNMKGRFMVGVSRDGTHKYIAEVVSGFATHKWSETKVHLDFELEKGDELWVRVIVGSGGAHRVYMKDFVLEAHKDEKTLQRATTSSPNLRPGSLIAESTPLKEMRKSPFKSTTTVVFNFFTTYCVQIVALCFGFLTGMLFAHCTHNSQSQFEEPLIHGVVDL